MPGFLVPTDAGILSVTPRTRGSYTDRNRSPGGTDYSLLVQTWIRGIGHRDSHVKCFGGFRVFLLACFLFGVFLWGVVFFFVMHFQHVTL